MSAGADVLFAERAGVIAAAKEKDLPVVGLMVDQQDRLRNVVTSSCGTCTRRSRPLVEQVPTGRSRRP